MNVKAEVKVKAERAANGRARSQRARVDTDEEEDTGRGGRRSSRRQQEESEDEEEDEEGGSPRGNKRQRVNGNGDARSSRAPTEDAEGDEDEDEDEDDGAPTDVLPKTQTLPRDVDGFIPGSIVRIQLRNFVTYDYVEFRPGAHLNMIVGPNGTGKSSIACAIALGLNFPAKVLGRASEINAFVKNGTESGYIEIELKGPAGKPNLVIKRSLSAKNKKTSFTLNGQPATGNEVSIKMAELNVQVENLCSFLPQDKVSSFAHMTPQQLLVETQKAAGDPNLSSWFETLKVEGKQLKEALQKLKEDEDAAKQMEERNANIEKEVERFKERQKIEQEIAVLELLVQLAQFRQVSQDFAVAKAEQRKAHGKMMGLKERNAPAHALEKELEKAAKKATERRDNQKKSMKAKAESLKKLQQKSEDLDSTSEEVISQLESLKKNEKDRIRNIKVKESDLERIQTEMDKPGPNLPDPAALAEEQKQLNLERNALGQERDETHNQMRTAVQQKVDAKAEIDRAKESLEKLDSTDSKKLHLLQKWDKDTYDSVIWLRRNKDKFKQQVFEPPILSVTVSNLDYAAYVEAGFNATQMKSFVAQSKEDLDTLNHYINDTTKALGRNVRVATWWRPFNPDTVPPAPLSPDQMQEIGFEGYINDYITYDPGMEYYLKKELSLHRIAVTRNPRIDVAKAMQAYGNVGGGTFINGFTINNVTRSRYGRKAVGNMTRDLGKPKNFIVPPVDTNRKRELEETIVERQQEHDLADELKQELQVKMNDILVKDKDIRDRADIIKARKAEIAKEAQRVNHLKARQTRLQNELKALLRKPPIDEERATLKKKLIKVAKERIELAKRYTTVAEVLYEEQVLCTKAGLEFIQSIANHTALKALCAVKDDKYQAAQVAFNAAHTKYAALKARLNEVMEEAQKKMPLLPPELQDKAQEVEDQRNQYDKEVKAALKEGRPPPSADGIELRTTDELMVDLDTQRTNLEMNINTNPGVVEEYEKRQRDIKQLQRTIKEIQKKVAKHNQKIKMHKDKWFPALQKLVDSIGKRFSAAFDRIGCAGEIRIKEDEDFEQWAIEIYVKFRDTEKLQLLTGQRQSGGERSLTTILYLMSLTEEARAPFSLVDEINQGMDQRAERVVHNSMVDVTCKEDSAQYFLITPKLLTDLNYHERMKVLCVNNGEWLPEERGLGNMMNMIEGYVQRNKETRGARSA